MFYISSVNGNQIGVYDTDDKVEETVTSAELCEYMSLGIEIVGAVMEGSVVSLTVHKSTGVEGNPVPSDIKPSRYSFDMSKGGEILAEVEETEVIEEDDLDDDSIPMEEPETVEVEEEDDIPMVESETEEDDVDDDWDIPMVESETEEDDVEEDIPAVTETEDIPEYEDIPEVEEDIPAVTETEDIPEYEEDTVEDVDTISIDSESKQSEGTPKVNTSDVIQVTPKESTRVSEFDDLQRLINNIVKSQLNSTTDEVQKCDKADIVVSVNENPKAKMDKSDFELTEAQMELIRSHNLILIIRDTTTCAEERYTFEETPTRSRLLTGSPVVFACSDDYLYFVGRDIRISLPSNVIADYEVKDTLLYALDTIIDVSDGKQSDVSLYGKCTGKGNCNIQVFAPFADELGLDGQRYEVIFTYRKE